MKNVQIRIEDSHGQLVASSIISVNSTLASLLMAKKVIHSVKNRSEQTLPLGVIGNENECVFSSSLADMRKHSKMCEYILVIRPEARLFDFYVYNEMSPKEYVLTFHRDYQQLPEVPNSIHFEDVPFENINQLIEVATNNPQGVRFQDGVIFVWVA